MKISEHAQKPSVFDILFFKNKKILNDHKNYNNNGRIIPIPKK